MKFDRLLDEIRELTEPMLQAEGLELVDLEYQREARGWVLRFYIDRQGGVTIDDCAAMSSELGTVLEVRDVIPNPYVLEVSSPGLTRPLKKPEHFNQFRNKVIKVKTFRPLEGRRNFKGVLLGLEDETVRLEADGRIYEIPFQDIAKANLELEI